MKQILIVLWLTLFCFISCSEKKSDGKKAEVDSTDNENKTPKKNIEFSTKDTLIFSSDSDMNDQIALTKDFDLFWIRDLDANANRKVGFISLSDIYPLSEHPDSLAINEEDDQLQYFKLNLTYRKRVLSQTNISETDSLFIYDYSTDVLLSFLVRELNIIAYLNDYIDVKDCPCNQSDYMIGFEVTKSKLSGLGKCFNNTLVFIGKENPFLQGQMKAILWQKIENEKFPLEKSNLTKTQKVYRFNNAIKRQAYFYENDDYQIFIQDYSEPNKLFKVQRRHLLVIDKTSGNMVNEKIFNNSEGASVAPLNYGINNSNYPDLKEQWTGKLFKDKPEVIFGFLWVSFGCPSIYYTNSLEKYIIINCDNRH